DARAQVALVRELQEQPYGLVRDAVLRVVEVEPGGVGGEALGALGISLEQIAQVLRRELGVVPLERLPRGALAQREGHERTCPSMCFRRSRHDSSNDCAPSSCSLAASAATSTPALANSASTMSLSPPSAGISSPTSPCSKNAFSVASGMVSTVNGADSPCT